MYRYGKDPKHNTQKYLCKSCRRQFTELSSIKKKSKYPKCPICGKGRYLHHDYLYYSHFTCNDKKCNHSIKVIKESTIKKISPDFLKVRYDYYVSHMSIQKWTTKFANIFKQVSIKYMSDSLSQSDEWHTDETVIKIRDKKYYI